MLLLTLLTGCIQDAPLPDLGACADYPEGIYEYGEIGIGTCLAGPTELAVVEDDAGAWTILVTNANPYQLFTGGSLLTIPWDNIDLSTGRNVVSDLSPVALDMPDFAGPLAITDDLAMVGVRYSEDARTRVASDEVYLVDVSDPAAPARSDRGPSGADTITVQSDPVSIVVDEETGLAFVANRTDHTISVIDTTGEELEIVLPWPEHVLNAAVFDDADGSGSTAVLADLEELEAENLDDDTWTMTWIAGTWRLWLPRDGALYRLTTTGNGIYTDSALGDELDPAEETTIEEVVDPFHFLLTGQLLFTSGGDIWAAVSDEYLGDWVVDSSALVTAQDGETLGGPSLLSASEVYWLYFDAEDESGFTINLAASEDGSTFSRYSTPVLEPTYDHELSGIQQPYVFYDWQADQWRMFYSAFDGARWTIGHAVSDDLLTWTADAEPIFSLDDVDVAAPVVSMEAGSYRMWYARRADGEEEWSFAAAESIAGLDWSEQEVLDATPVAQDTPPRPALQSGPTAAFRVESELVGNLSTELSPGETLSTSQGWSASALAGYWLGTDAVGSRSEGGIRIDSIDTDAGLAWLTLTGAAGTPRIGLATIDALGVPTAESDAIFAGEGGYDADGVSSPVVWRHTDGTWRMAYAAHDGDFTTTALATSSDGRSWSRVGEIITNGPDWDSVSVVPSAIQTTSTGWRLWYSGFNGDSWEIGSASSADGETWTRDSEQPVFEAGSAGDWDDSGVQDAWLLSDDGSISGEVGDHMWYAGFDGDSWRIGYAWRADGSEDWVRAETVETEEPRPVLTTTGGMFHPSGLHRPVVTAEGGDLTMWYAGLFGEVERVGQAIGREPARLFKSLRRPTVGDTLSFDTERGDESVEAIPLDGSVETLSVTGVGLTSLDLDAERGFLYVTSKLLPYIIVIDVRDDSTEDFSDLNYLDIEAVMVANTLTDSSGSGYRKVIAPAGSEHLYAINDSPESVFILDTSELVDDAYGDWIYATQIGWLPTPVSNRDAGVDSQTPIGPAQMAFHPDRDQLLVTNFNANSISAYDLALGPYGTLVREVTLIGENPYAITITPDGLHAVFANYSGEVDPDGLTEASLGILDLDPTSPTYLTVLTWITNR